MIWPPGALTFTIHKQSGKKRGEGNGVTPIKTAFVAKLVSGGWEREMMFPAIPEGEGPRASKPGKFDAGLRLDEYADPPSIVAPFAVEWETGNISSSHRALNKICLGLLRRQLLGGGLVLPTRKLAQYLTDRIGNFEEIEPYFELWSALPIPVGFLTVIGVEHDAASQDVPRISKGTDGRSLT